MWAMTWKEQEDEPLGVWGKGFQWEGTASAKALRQVPTWCMEQQGSCVATAELGVGTEGKVAESYHERGQRVTWAVSLCNLSLDLL